MSFTLCLDFGNTRRKAAVFQDGNIIKHISLENDLAGIQSLLQEFKPDKSILSTVVNHTEEIEALLAAKTQFHLLSHQTLLPFTTPVNKPASIGADRLALAAAAIHLHPNKNNLVIGLGTCVTYNFINNKNEFIGGAISPGMEMRFKAMHHFTAKLPLAIADWNVPVIGYDTQTNLTAGVILGMALEIDGFINEYQQRFENFNVLLTGGDIRFLGSHIKNEIFADPDLIFKGLYAISVVNNV
ncbi:MAG: type III pantothenate kinase [Chitinophagaceae bacterium]|jgi:type III pantothenate kinase|nr:type III pantothenate kinase [Chitinophagaceae bacterium]